MYYIYSMYYHRPLAVLPSIFSGMSSFESSYQKALFATLEKQLVASLEVSGWGVKLVCQLDNSLNTQTPIARHGCYGDSALWSSCAAVC